MPQVGPSFFKNQERIENNAFQTEGGEKNLEERIQQIVPKISEIKEAATLWTIANKLIEEGHASHKLKKLNEEDLENLCDPCDPAVIIAIVQYLEVNKNERKKLN